LQEKFAFCASSSDKARVAIARGGRLVKIKRSGFEDDLSELSAYGAAQDQGVAPGPE
jgi:hypothetical protein